MGTARPCLRLACRSRRFAARYALCCNSAPWPFRRSAIADRIVRRDGFPVFGTPRSRRRQGAGFAGSRAAGLVRVRPAARELPVFEHAWGDPWKSPADRVGRCRRRSFGVFRKRLNSPASFQMGRREFLVVTELRMSHAPLTPRTARLGSRAIACERKDACCDPECGADGGENEGAGRSAPRAIRRSVHAGTASRT